MILRDYGATLGLSNYLRIYSIFLFVFLLPFPKTLAQTTISGTVKDEKGGLIPAAQVSIKADNFQTSVLTDENGKFIFSNLPTSASEYELSVYARGFNPYVRKIQAGTIIEITLMPESLRFTVTAEYGEKLEKELTPQAVNLISRESILDRSTVFLARVAEQEAGINVQRTSPSLGGIFIRGLAGKNVVVYVDGVRFTNAAQRGGINTFFNLNEPSSLERIEVIRGASSAQFGSDALGGTINLVSLNNSINSDKPIFNGELSANAQTADRSGGSFAILSYGADRFNLLLNLAGRRINRLRPARGIDSHSALTRFLGISSKVLGERLPDTEFTQYGGALRLSYLPTNDLQIILNYHRSQQDDGKRYDQLLGGDGNLIADLKNLMTDFGYVRLIKQNLSLFDSASITFSYNSQREERVNQGGQGDPFGSITHQYERTSVSGFNFFLDKTLEKLTLGFGGDYYFEKINSPAFTVNPRTNTSTLSRPRIPDEARFRSSGVFLNGALQLQRIRFSGALRYSFADYKARAADAPIVAGRRLWQDDSLRVGSLSGRIGFVLRLIEQFSLAANYSRGFRYPNMTDLGTLGLTGSGYEVDYLSAVNLGGTIGTTADSSAVSTGIPVSKQRSEFSNNFDLSFRYTHKRFETEFTGFLLDIEDIITKQSLILPPGAVGKFLGDQQIINQLPNGVVFVALSTSPVLVRANYSAARIYGIEAESEAWLTKSLKFTANYTFVHAKDKTTGLPPNIEGGTPPPTTFVSFKYQPIGKNFWIELYSILAQKQNRLSSLDIEDRRTGALRTRGQIANFFRRGACVRGLTNNPDGVCGTGDETILLLTGETLAQVQNRVLGIGVNSAPMFTYLPSYGLLNLRGGIRLNEKQHINWAIENIFDRPYRNPSWGIDGAGRNFRVAYRIKF